MVHENLHYSYGFPGGSVVKYPPANEGGWVLIPGEEGSLEKGMATHSSILAWNIPWAEECVRLHSPWGHRESDTTEPLHFLF